MRARRARFTHARLKHVGDETEIHDDAVHWRMCPAIAQIRRAGRCPSCCVPRKLRVPGGLVALVTDEERVLCLFALPELSSECR